MNRVLFVQRKAHRAGAQSCLERLLRFNAASGGAALLCGEKGWLTDACERSGVPVLIEPFPNSRSLAALLYGNAAFAKRAANRVRQAGFAPRIIHANDHNEGLLALLLAKRLDARSAIFLRSSAMTRRDYFKYGCGRFDLVIAVGDDLQRAASSWHPGKEPLLIHDGLFESEFLAPKPRAQEPRRVLVIGNAGEAKGWGDLAEAVSLLESREIAVPSLDFTGNPAGKSYLPLLEGLRTPCRYLERAEDFRALATQYDLVINPSRNESFGMAAIEVLAAGVPLLSSRTGVIDQVQRKPEMLFAPRDPLSLANAFENVLRRWSEIDFGTKDAQDVIRERFLIVRTAENLNSAYSGLRT